MTGSVLLAAAGVIAGLMVATWLVSLAIKDASIVDLIWGFGFVLVAWVTRFIADGETARQNLLVAMATIWGLRLSAYLSWRNLGEPEDFRYRSMRERCGPRFPLISLGVVFGFQGITMWVVSLPLQLGQIGGDEVGIIAIVGVVVWLIGLAFESIGDWQLARFKAEPGNAGKVMDRGVWGWTRHPNYFGDACVWWGMWLVAAETNRGIVAIIGPIVMTYMLLRVSGVAMLERSLTKRREGYQDYIARTNAFIPGPRKKSS